MIKKLITGLLVVFIFGFLVSCSYFMVGNTPSEVKKIYDKLDEMRASTRPVTNSSNTPAAFKHGRIDQFVEGFSCQPSPRFMNNYDWTGIEEGDIKLDTHTIYDDGFESWIILSIQNGKNYIVVANNDDEEKMPMGISQTLEMGKYVWYFRWE